MFSTPLTFLKFILSGGGLDPDAQAFLTATGITDPTISSAINTLVVDLKAANLWSKFYAIYPLVGGTSTTTKYNLKDPQDTDAAYRITWNGSVTYSSSGVEGAGGYGNTNLIWSAIPSYTQYPFSTIYMNDSDYSLAFDFGALNTTTNAQFIGLISYGDNTTYVRIQNSQGYLTYNQGGVNGLYSWGQNSVNGRFININGTTVTTAAIGTFTAPDVKMFLLGLNIDNGINSPSSRRYAFAGFGEVLSSANASTLYTIVQAFNTTLGRQV
jgi:hypothetical protein